MTEACNCNDHNHWLATLVVSSFFPPLSILPFPSIFASLPLEVGTLNPARGSGVEPQRKFPSGNLVHFSIKIWRLMAQILLESTHLLENWYNVSIKILACQIIGPAAAGSAGPVPTALKWQSVTILWNLRSTVARPSVYLQCPTIRLFSWRTCRSAVLCCPCTVRLVA